MNLKNLNLAEWFAFSRVITFPIVILLIISGERQITAWFYLIMFSTDFLDGFFAYFLNMDGKRRAQLDTLGDILFILAGIFGLFIFEKDFFLEQLIWIMIVAFLYLLQLTCSMVRFGKPTFFHTYLAKTATASHVLFICHMFFFSAHEVLFLVSVALSILEVIEEIIMVFTIKDWKENVKGLWAMERKRRDT